MGLAAWWKRRYPFAVTNTMKLNLLLLAGAAVALAGCQSKPDWNNGPYARYGFTYDYVLSPIADLSVEDAQAVLATPGGLSGQMLLLPDPATSYRSVAPSTSGSTAKNGSQMAPTAPVSVPAPQPKLSSSAPPPTSAPQ